MMNEDSTINLFNPVLFRELRKNKQRKFEQEMCERSNPFVSLTSFLFNKRDFYEQRQKAQQKHAIEEGTQKSQLSGLIDYEELLKLIPPELNLTDPVNRIW